MIDAEVRIGPDTTIGDDSILDINIKSYHYPIYFERRNICTSCGAEGDLVFINVFGKEVSHEVHPFEHLKCKRCGAEYSIKWDKDPEDQKLYPSAVDRSIVGDFLNCFKKNSNKVKDFDNSL